MPFVQEPIAIIGLACRLPGDSNTPTALWDFLQQGGIAKTTPPTSRFNFEGHYDGSAKPGTMRSPGGMFLENVNPCHFDASFFRLSKVEAVSMDPQQRQLLEVIYEGLENAGITLDVLNGQKFGCFVGSYASDYGEIQSRDPEDRAASTTVGIGRAMLSNRISHFLNITGPSMTIDTACSGGLVGIDVACRYLQTHEIDGALVAGCNMYLSPEHTMDYGMRDASSPSGKCHTFDIKADGYMKSEAVNMVVLKRLDDALRNGDPIRAVIRGSATNSDGWTAGIASPSSKAQAAAIRQAYQNANISDLSATRYLECHGTGTQAGDPIEVAGIASVFSTSFSRTRPLILGSIKSNIGHSEPAAGISGLLKVILALEKGTIPGNPTFETPNPKIDFCDSRLSPSKVAVRWPAGPFRRASVNSFGYGGSNAHLIVDDGTQFVEKSSRTHVSSYLSDTADLLEEDDDGSYRLYTLVFSANDEHSLRSYCKEFCRFMINPRVKVKLRDLAYTLSERRTRHFHRAFAVVSNCSIDESEFTFGKMQTNTPRIGFVFTGQGAQWSGMGKELLAKFPATKMLLNRLESALHSLPHPPTWSLAEELTEQRTREWLQNPELSQTLVTALQLLILQVLGTWGVHCQSVVGHSSGEIAAATAAGYLTPEQAIKVAYYRGKAAADLKRADQAAVGMMAVGLGSDDIQPYISGVDSVEIGCINSPDSITLTGNLLQLELLGTKLQQDGHFARALQVELAYHSQFMSEIAIHYQGLLERYCDLGSVAAHKSIKMFSSVTGEILSYSDASYWKNNMVSKVLFSQAVQGMVSGPEGSSLLIEIGPSASLSGPISQIKKALSNSESIEYMPSLKRSNDSIRSLFEIAGKISVLGGSINMQKVNIDDDSKHPSVIVDLPNYAWNHTTEFWHESIASRDWRFRKFIRHDLLGTKVLGTSWNEPSWKNAVKVQDLQWLKHHRLGKDIVFPASGYIAMAIEAFYQKSRMTGAISEETESHKISYRLRNTNFTRALVLEENVTEGCLVMLTLTSDSGTWHKFNISSLLEGVWHENCRGFITKKEEVEREVKTVQPLRYPVSAGLWYKAMRDIGYEFGPSFQKQIEVEALPGRRANRALVSMSQPDSKFQQSFYPIHPACIDGCFQSGAPSLWEGHRSSVNAVLVPALLDELIIYSQSSRPEKGMASSVAEYLGVGRHEDAKNYKSNVEVCDAANGLLLLQMKGLRYHKLDTGLNIHASHTYTRVSWKPDVTFLAVKRLCAVNDTTKGELTSLLNDVQNIIDIIVHKTPNGKVLESHLVSGHDSLWLNERENRAKYRAPRHQYFMTAIDATELVKNEGKYGGSGNSEFGILDLTKAPGDFEFRDKGFTLILLKMCPLSKEKYKNVICNARHLLSDSGYLLIIHSDESDHKTNGLYHPESDSGFGDMLFASNFELTLHASNPDYGSVLLARSGVTSSEISRLRRKINVLSFVSGSDQGITKELTKCGWDISQHSSTFDLQQKTTVLVLDELHSSVLSNITNQQWEQFQHLIELGSQILWVTAGSLFEVTQPEKALVHGLARTLRAEDPRLTFMTLDVESGSSIQSLASINQILQLLVQEKCEQPSSIESEFCERRGVIYISRVVPDDLINKAEMESTTGPELVAHDLFSREVCTRLKAERLGSLDSLIWGEVSKTEIPLGAGIVEIDMYVASLNFKDIAVTMGLVPADETLLGLEGSGIIRRVGSDVGDIRVGQRVLVSRKGSFANFHQSPVEAVHPIPDSMSFEDAATLPTVFLTTMYGLIDLANTKRGQRVLISSAAGGVGIAAIQLCKYLGAEIFCLVGNNEKREFLVDTYGIPPNHIFSSRSVSFAPKLMEATNDKGVDVVLNSLSGDLLDESWRCIADCGTMIEIGKQDMLERGSLSMEPFQRNASYRAIDMSHDSISLSTIARLLSQIMKLVDEGHLKPISPQTTFPYTDVAGALRYMRSGNHMGKIILSNGPNRKDVKVPIRPLQSTLNLEPEKSYLIVGGLKGLCGSLATYLSRLGAKHLTILSRSGYEDEKSKMVLMHLKALGTETHLVKGDVTAFHDVQRIFQEAKWPIAGIIQGAMVLRDKIFGSMTVSEFHEAISPKVCGTWNLHYASLEQAYPLQFFTLLSSISGLVGQRAQANYSAANVFLDSFSAYRNSLGLRACSVDLGVIEDVGYISERETISKRLDTSVWTGINEGLLHKILRFSILQQIEPINPKSASCMVTGIPVPQKADSFLLRDARFSALNFGTSVINGSGLQDGGVSNDVRAFLMLLAAKIDMDTILKAAIDLVNKQFMRILGMNEPMEPGKPFSGYGIDSLAAVEFRNWARNELGCEITSLEIINSKSLSTLCGNIIANCDPA